jgi:hypothetical protein
MVRDAGFSDIPRIVAIMRDAYTRTAYAKREIGNLDEREAKRILVNAIGRHGRTGPSGAFVQVAERHGQVEGFIVGILTRVYHIGDRLQATDLFWYSTPLGHPRDSVKLMRNMVAWAKACPHVVEVLCGATALLQDPEHAGRILKALGMQPYGQIYRMET